MSKKVNGIILSVSLALLFCILYSHDGHAQRSLAITKNGRLTNIRFETKDEIKVWLGDEVLKGELSYIGDSIILITDIEREISFNEITAIRYTTKGSGVGLLKQMIVKFPIAGGLLLMMDIVNKRANPKYSQFSTGLIIVAGALIISGPIAYLLVYHKYKIGKRKQLKMLDLTIN